MKYFYDDDRNLLIGVELDALKNPTLRFFKEVGSGESIDDVPPAKPQKSAGGGQLPKKKAAVKEKDYKFEKFDAKGKKPRKCGVCGQPGHRKEKCPNGAKVAADENEAAPAPEEGTEAKDKPLFPMPPDAAGLSEEDKEDILAKFNGGQPPHVSSSDLAKEYQVSIKAIWWVIRTRPQQ